jgi:hypothetical protein
MNEDDAVRAALSQYFNDSRPAGYAGSFRAGWDAGKQWATTPVCQDCGMRHEPNDRASCIEGHGDDLEWGEDSVAQQLERGPR